MSLPMALGRTAGLAKGGAAAATLAAQIQSALAVGGGEAFSIFLMQPGFYSLVDTDRIERLQNQVSGKADLVQAVAADRPQLVAGPGVFDGMGRGPGLGIMVQEANISVPSGSESYASIYVGIDALTGTRYPYHYGNAGGAGGGIRSALDGTRILNDGTSNVLSRTYSATGLALNANFAATLTFDPTLTSDEVQARFNGAPSFGSYLADGNNTTTSIAAGPLVFRALSSSGGLALPAAAVSYGLVLIAFPTGIGSAQLSAVAAVETLLMDAAGIT